MKLRLRSVYFIATVTLAIFGDSWLAAAEEAKRPNILFIYADDQSYKTLSCYDGHPDWVKTPNIDRLAQSGVRFERSYLGPWCMPSRASLLTGRLQHGVQSMTMEGTYPGSRYDPAQCPFIPAQFRQQGYQTAHIGKWHTGTDAGFGRDWDFQIVWNRPKHPSNAGNYYEGQVLTINGADVQVDGYSTDNYTRWACDYIQGQNRDPQKPWYLWLCYGAVHGPTTPAARHRGQLKGHQAPVPADIVGPRTDKPAYLENTQAWVLDDKGRPAMAKRGKKKESFDVNEPGKDFHAWVQQVNECMLSVDEGVGQVLKALSDSGQLDNTLVVYSADQGFGLGEHGFSQKVAPYDATLASPMIVSWAGKLPSGKVCRHPINSPDLVDYFCRTAGVEIPWKTHGRDIRPLLDNPETTTWNSPVLLTHTSRNYGQETNEIPTDERLTSSSGVPWYAMLRDGPFKYIRNFVEGETEELYDLQNDPEELTNLATRPEHAQRLVSLRKKAIDELRRTDAGFVDKLPKTRAELQSSKADVAPHFFISTQDDRVIIREGEQTFAEYVLHDKETNKPYLWPVYGPSGQSMTRSFPMKQGLGEKEDHFHHRGIWFGHQDLGGYNTWAEAKTYSSGKKPSDSQLEAMRKLGFQKHRGFRSMTVERGQAILVEDIDYVSPEGKRVVSEIRTLSFHRDEKHRYIDFDQVFIATDGDVIFGDEKDAGLSARMPHAVAVDTQAGGSILTSRGLKDKDAWGKRAEWCEYSGEVDGQRLGISILNHPQSFRSPTTWHVRTYGLFTANPFGTLDPESPNGPHTLKAGQQLKLHHRIVLHDNRLDSASLEALNQAYARSDRP
jgi:arylsulfatase A-like enzyme